MTPTTRSRLPIPLVLAAYLLLLARITLWPDNPDDERTGLLGWAVDGLAALGVTTATAAAVTEAVANVLLFVPYGLLLALIAHPGRRWLAVVIPALASVAIETAQSTLLPDRVATVQDVVMNTLGAVIGVGIAALVHRRTARRPAGRSGTRRGRGGRAQMSSGRTAG